MPTHVPVPSARRRVIGALVVAIAVVVSTGAATARAPEPVVDDAGSRIETKAGLDASTGDGGDLPAPLPLVVTRALPFDTARALVVDHTHGRIFVSGDNAVAVLDLDGTLVGYLEGHPGAAGMVVAGDSLYVAETTAGAIGRITLGPTPTNAAPITTGLVNPREVAFAGGALWTITGACTELNVLSRIALPSGAVTTYPSSLLEFAFDCPLLDGAGGHVLVTTFSRSSFLFDVSGASPTALARRSDMPTPQDIALSPDGTIAFVVGASSTAPSFAAPALTPGTAYPGPVTASSTSSIAITGARGGLVAAGRAISPNLSLYALGNPNAVWQIDVGRSVNPNGIGFRSDGSRVYAIAKREDAIFDLHVIDVEDATSQYGEFHPIEPQRLHDSRLVGDRVTELRVSMEGRFGIAATGVSAVAVNVTITDPSLAGYLSVYPTGQPRPNASTLNFEAGQTIPNMTIVGVGSDGAIALFASQPTHVIVDAVGWFGSATAPSGSLFHAMAPTRWFDTREDRRGDGSIRPLGPGEFVGSTFTGGRTTTASGIGAVALNVTATNTTADSFLAVSPMGPPPPSSNLNWKAGETVPNAVITKIDAVGGRAQFTNAFGRTDVIADVFGYWDNRTTHAGKRFYPVAPSRIVDTRSGYLAPGSVMGRADRLSGWGVVSVKATGGLPPGTTAVVLNITAVQPSEQGFLSAFPLGLEDENELSTSIVNFMPGNVRPNMVILPVGAGGEIVVANGSGGTIDIVADITGYFR